jgi:hypothetical protein
MLAVIDMKALLNRTMVSTPHRSNHESVSVPVFFNKQQRKDRTIVLLISLGAGQKSQE